ncbi:hypothetical protein [Marinomonas mediterranea]|uniref:hypothetical protein n=1 Tax=Marinomonas mediterranea TaxID=119864 RepID=UPI0023491D90|nr:hypothetical protein [Marinomonas mediterranea]
MRLVDPSGFREIIHDPHTDDKIRSEKSRDRKNGGRGKSKTEKNEIEKHDKLNDKWERRYKKELEYASALFNNIRERYVKQQMENIHKYMDILKNTGVIDMMADLEPYVNSQDYMGFWNTASEYGDPLSKLAIGFHTSLYGDSWGNKVANSKLELAFTGGNYRLSVDQLKALKRTVGIEVMDHHYDALTNDIIDRIGTPGSLSVKQIDDYHYNLFDDMKLPNNAYGGHLLSWSPQSFRRMMYCTSCDPISSP